MDTINGIAYYLNKF